MTWNQTLIDELFPRGSAKKVTILRDPVTLLSSAWKYYYSVMYPRQAAKMSTADRVAHLNTLLQQPTAFYTEMMQTLNRRRHTLRSQLFSFHGPKVWERNLEKDKVREMIREMDAEFDLVLIMEYFDLGLALLSIELCWPLKYVSYLKMNAGMKAKVKKKNYHEELIRVINYPDFMLYEHFNATFWKRIHAVGLVRVQNMANEIQEYSSL